MSIDPAIVPSVSKNVHHILKNLRLDDVRTLVKKNGPQKKKRVPSEQLMENLMSHDEVRKVVTQELERETKRTELFSKPLTITKGGKTYHVIEGDIMLNEEQYQMYESKKAELEKLSRELQEKGLPTLPPQSLLGMITHGGKLVRWDRQRAQNLTYWVDKDSFNGYKVPGSSISTLMQMACSSWMEVCGVLFKEVNKKEEDHLFEVRFNNTEANTGLMAAAFFPNSPVAERFLDVFPDFSETGFDMVGILRHELGHILGFRHEHIRVLGGEPEEVFGATLHPITQVDRKSVMFYFIPGVGGSKEGKISELDERGAQYYYGGPIHSFDTNTPSSM
jgi:hypothetical protein